MDRALWPAVVLVLTIMFAPPAQADWQGTMTMKSPGGHFDMRGTISGRLGGMRMDMHVGAGPNGPVITTIVDLIAKRAFVLVPSMKRYVEMSPDPSTQGVVCDIKNTEKCLTAKGFHKVGRETVNGHPCTVYEGNPKTSSGGTRHMKLWHPTDFKEVPMVKSVITMDDGRINEMNIVELKSTKLADNLFVLPEGYAPTRSATPEQK